MYEAWLVKGEAELIPQTAGDTIKLTVKSEFFASQIRNRFESDLMACSGAARIELEVKEAGAPEPAP
jgi:hypothetical protein